MRPHCLQAVAAALLFEKNTLLFLSEMRKLVPRKDQKTVDELIDEASRGFQTPREVKQGRAPPDLPSRGVWNPREEMLTI